MDCEDQKLNRLVETARVTRRNLIAVDLACATRYLTTATMPTLEESAELTAAQAACDAADLALDDYE